MATSVVTAATTQVTNDQKLVTVIGTFSIGAGSYVTGGLPFSFHTLIDVQSGGKGPVWVEIRSTKFSGFLYAWNPGGVLAGSPPALSDGTVQIGVTGASSGQPLSELAAGAMPAGVTGDTIVFEAKFLRNAN